jgi:hypothetical protein
MANGHGGRRPGAGGIPRDLSEPIDFRPVRQGDGSVVQQPLNVFDLVEEAIRAGGFLHDAAARVGITVETLREWRKQGVKANADVLNGRKRRAHLSRRQRQYAELAARIDRAEAEARLMLLGVGRKLAQGGIVQQEIVEKVTPTPGGGDVVVERTTRTSETIPDSRMITWLLAHRWPNDFHGRQELTGPNGGPITVDTAPAKDKLRQLLGDHQPTDHHNGHERAQPATNSTQTPPNGHHPPHP